MGQTAALFDVDNTLLDTSSGQLWARHQYRTGSMTRSELARVTWWAFLGRLGVLDMHKLIPKMLAQSAGVDEGEMRLGADRWFAEDVIPHISERGRQRLAEHQAMGHIVGIVSASTQYVVEPLTVHLGIPGHYVCTHLKSKDGRLTGEVIELVCYGQGKVVWAERFAAEYEVDLSASVFYTDSISDLPLLEVVGWPVAVNPDLKLRRLAAKRGWPIETFY